MTIKSRTLAAAVLLALSGVLPGICSAQAPAGKVVAYDIPAQPLEVALKQLADKSSLQLLYSPADLKGVSTRGLKGTYNTRDAVDRLVEGTGLVASFDGQNAVAIKPKSDDKRAGAPGGAPQDPIQLAQAQSAERREAAGPAAIQRLDAITVTAQKRTELLIDVPQSVTVLSGEQLTKLGATQFRDFADKVPGLTYFTQGAGFSNISLRGVTAGTDVSRTVGLYVDEVPYGSSTTFARGYQISLDVGLFDLDRIEVLKGPQGTLYGASSLGGLIKYVTKRPNTSRFEGNAQAGISTTENGRLNYNAAGSVNVPLGNGSTAVRLNAFHTRDGGFINNVALGQEDVDRSTISGGRADFLFAPNAALNVRLTAFAQDVSRDGQSQADYPLAGIPAGSVLTDDPALEQRRLFQEPFDQQFRLFSATIDYDFGKAQLTSVTSYQKSDTEFFTDSSVTLVPVLRSAFNRNYRAFGVTDKSKTDKFVQEVRVASKDRRTLEWLAGAFYTREESEYGQTSTIIDAQGLPAPNDVFAFNRPSRYEEAAAFGDLTWHFSEAADVTGGLRYSRNKSSFSQDNAGILAGRSVPTVRAEDNTTTYLANARYRFSDAAMGYVRFATGYRPGGPNSGAAFTDPATGLPLAPPTFEADELKSYEIGFKGESGDRRLSYELAAYYLDWKNIQISVTRNGIGIRANAPGGATVRGAEAALIARPSTSLTITGSLAYQDATLAAADPDLRAEKGARLPNVPKWMGNVAIDYAFGTGRWRPTLGGSLRYVGERTVVITSNSYRLPDYTALDLRAGMSFGALGLQVYVHNALDERGQASAAIAAGILSTSIIQPRTVGLLATTRF